MRFSLSLVLFLLFAITGTAHAGELREIELTDGSVVTGEVVSLQNGVYTIRTGSLGTVTVNESSVRAIRQPGTPGSAAMSDPHQSDVRSLQERMLRDQDIMTMIQSLQNDPEFQKILRDPEVMRAVNAGDIPALTANPEFMKLLQNSTVQEIQKKVAK
jgi:hypothetical protein